MKNKERNMRTSPATTQEVWRGWHEMQVALSHRSGRNCFPSSCLATKRVPDLAFNGQDYAVPVTDKTAFLLKDLIFPTAQKNSMGFYLNVHLVSFK